jgi:hypothetical protein
MGEEDGPTYVPSKGWAEMIRKVYEVDPLRCPTCGPSGTPDSSRGDWGVFLRTSLAVLCLLEGRVYLELDGLEIPGNLCRFLSH